jgi:hypothetical protein
VLFNFMLEVPHADSSFPSEFVPAYVCRPGKRCAYMYVGFGPHADGWHIYTETTVFEYEWVGRRDDSWVPTEAAVKYVALARGDTELTTSGVSSLPVVKAGFGRS